jgi:hypothetical protein
MRGSRKGGVGLPWFSELSDENSTREMTTYLFQGKVHPEHATITLQHSLEFTHPVCEQTATARISILLNQIAVWVDTSVAWNIYDLRNIVKTIVSNELEFVGFVNGCAYHLEITRVLNQEHEVDEVFGVDIPCIVERNKDVNLADRLAVIRSKTDGPDGIFLRRCFADLVNAMRNADDTGFYCYRAIESLRQHCIVRFDLDPSDKNKKNQWSKLREVAGCSEGVVRQLEESAKALRHGEVVHVSSDQRMNLFLLAWDVVDGYIMNV